MNEKLESINSYTYDTLVSVLLQMVPEYRSVYEQKHSDVDLPSDSAYLIMNEFAAYLSEEIAKNKTSSFVTKSFAYINLLGASNNLEVLNVVRVGILEILYTEKGVERDGVRAMLSDKLKPFFDAFSHYYN